MLDHASYSWSAAAPALAELQRRHIPLIFCTSKTAAELDPLCRAMGNDHPFIAENGGLIRIPARYFGALSTLGRNAQPLSLRLGCPYPELLRQLKRIARETGVEVRGFHQMSDAEVAHETGLSRREAQRARRRETSEPFVVHSGSPAAIRSFYRRARGQGYSVHRGGRFWHFSGACDKGLGVSVLLGLYRSARGNLIRTVALGDSGNDLSMLQLVDCPIVIPKPDGSYARELVKGIPGVIRAKQSGPAGWNTIVLQELAGSSSPPSSRNGARHQRLSARSTRT